MQLQKTKTWVTENTLLAGLWQVFDQSHPVISPSIKKVVAEEDF